MRGEQRYSSSGSIPVRVVLGATTMDFDSIVDAAAFLKVSRQTLRRIIDGDGDLEGVQVMVHTSD